MPTVLIVIDPLEEQHHALDRMTEISATADVDYVVALYVDIPRIKDTEKNPLSLQIKDGRTWLEELVTPIRSQGYRITTQVMPFTQLDEAIIETVTQVEADFVFKPFRQHGALQRLLTTSTDGKLIRQCPAPVLLVSHESQVKGRPVVAALDLEDRDDAHAVLNRVVIEQSRVLAEILQSEVHYLYAYQTTSALQATTDIAAYSTLPNYRDRLATYSQELADTYGITRESLHYVEGPAREVIVEYAEEVSAGVTVLGTVGRTGLSGALVGNTAETVHEKSVNDLMVVRAD